LCKEQEVLGAAAYRLSSKDVCEVSFRTALEIFLCASRPKLIWYIFMGVLRFTAPRLVRSGLDRETRIRLCSQKDVMRGCRSQEPKRCWNRAESLGYTIAADEAA
jgi:hypothetical protein